MLHFYRRFCSLFYYNIPSSFNIYSFRSQQEQIWKYAYVLVSFSEAWLYKYETKYAGLQLVKS